MTFKRYKHLNVPDSWERYFTKYPQGMSILESLFEWVSQVDNMVDNQNNLNTTVENYGLRLDDFLDLFDTNLRNTAEETLKDWQTSGFLDVVISEALQWQLDDYITTNEQDKLTLSNQIQQTGTRIDTFTTLESGSTTGDAELIDGRVSADGVVYSNIGGAIRNQITDITQGNALLKSEWIGGFVAENGGIEENPNVITQTEMHPILPSETIRITIADGYSFAISWYNSSGVIARRASSWVTETTEITYRYAFYRLSILKTGISLSDSNKIGVKKINYYLSADEIKNTVGKLGGLEHSFYPIGEAYKHLFSNAICIGDSLTRGFYTSELHNDDGALPTYPQTLAKITGWTVTQGGRSGATAKSWYNDRLNLFDYAAHELAIIYLGTNAGLESYSTTETDTTNLGCYRKIIQRILTDNPTCKILMCTVSSVSGSTVETTNDSIRSLANEFANCFVIDLKDNGIVNLSEPSLHPYDPVHFTGIGYMTQAYVIASLIKRTISNNVASFDIIS